MSDGAVVAEKGGTGVEAVVQDLVSALGCGDLGKVVPAQTCSGSVSENLGGFLALRLDSLIHRE